MSSTQPPHKRVGRNPNRGHGRGKSPTHPTILRGHEHFIRALQMRTEGKRLTEIAETLGLAISTVSEGMQRIINRERSENVEAYRAVENLRLDRLVEVAWPLLAHMDPNIQMKAITEMCRINRCRCALNGIDKAPLAPVGPDGKPVGVNVTVVYEDRLAISDGTADPTA
jgi:hypothetical protein